MNQCYIYSRYHSEIINVLIAMTIPRVYSVVWQNLNTPGVWQAYVVVDIWISSFLYISRHFSSWATFYFGPFQPLRTSDALSRCNVAVRLRTRAASITIFAFFLPLWRCKARSKKSFPSCSPMHHTHSRCRRLATVLDVSM